MQVSLVSSRQLYHQAFFWLSIAEWFFPPIDIEHQRITELFNVTKTSYLKNVHLLKIIEVLIPEHTKNTYKICILYIIGQEK